MVKSKVPEEIRNTNIVYKLGQENTGTTNER